MKWIKERFDSKDESIGKRVAKIQSEVDSRIMVNFDKRMF